MAYQSQKYRLIGLAPMILHNGQTRDPLNAFSKALKKVSGKRNKTDADHEEMAKIEFFASLYLFDGRVCMPGENLERMILDAARKMKLGKQVQAGLFCPGVAVIEYEGPKTPDELWEDERFRFTHAVKVNGSAVMRTRVRFDQWAFDMEVRYDPELIDLGQLHQIMQIAADMIGCGEWRPRYGRFKVQPL
jgi:hypothetical protein